jgi:hypothetical protein
MDKVSACGEEGIPSVGPGLGRVQSRALSRSVPAEPPTSLLELVEGRRTPQPGSQEGWGLPECPGSGGDPDRRCLLPMLG